MTRSLEDLVHRIIDIPVQQIPKPTVHAVLRWDTHLANLKRVRSILSENLAALMNLNERRCLVARKRGMFENQVHCRPFSKSCWRLYV